MKKTIFFFFLAGVLLATRSQSQEFTLKKGIITDSLSVTDDETYALYLPPDFDMNRKWPLIFVADMQGRGKRVISMFKNAAERHGYILVGSNSINDTISVTQNILMTGRLIRNVAELVPLEKERIYAAGFSSGAKFASLLPAFIKEVHGVISMGSAIPNYELLSSRNRFHFIGIVGNEDFNYADMVEARPELKRLKILNHLWVFNGGHQWPDPAYLDKALAVITLKAMSKGSVPKDEAFVLANFNTEIEGIELLLNESSLLNAYNQLSEVISIYQLHVSVDSLIERRKALKKNKLYRTQKRDENAALFKESLFRDDYQYNLLEDISTLNYNNLGWWNYQVEELKKFEQKSLKAEQRMGLRLTNWLNALIEDNIDIEAAEDPVNDEALSFLWMLKTITEPGNYDYYLKIISDSARYEDFGTSLFYLEELLKQGYNDKASLYSLDHTALLRITPEFNELIKKYLKDSRYEINEE